MKTYLPNFITLEDIKHTERTYCKLLINDLQLKHDAYHRNQTTKTLVSPNIQDTMML